MPNRGLPIVVLVIYYIVRIGSEMRMSLTSGLSLKLETSYPLLLLPLVNKLQK